MSSTIELSSAEQQAYKTITTAERGDDRPARELKGYGDSYDNIVRQLDEQPIQEEDLSGDVEVVEEGPKGTVYKEYRTCGDESCHCMSGGEKHGPYKYRASWEDGTVKKEYLGKAE